MNKSVKVIEESSLRLQYYILILLASFRDEGIDRKELAEILSEARGVLGDEQYKALNADVRMVL